MTREQKQHILHFAVSSLGGFMGGYAIYNHCDVFGNAQTANMIHLVSKIFTGDFEGVVFIVIALLTYILGNVFFVIADRFIKLETKTVSLIASTVALLIIGIFPNISNNYLAILPILFVTPVLWNSFRTAGSYVTSPIFSTNNLRVATVSTFTGIIDKDKDMKKKAKFYWLTLASYHIGVVLACVPSVFIGVNSIWFGFVSISLSTVSYMWLCGVFDREESFAASEGLAAQSEII